MERRYSKFFPPVLLVVDLIILNIAFFAAFYSSFDTFNFHDYRYNYLLAFINVAWIVISIVLRQYKYSRISTGLIVIKRLFLTIIIHLLLVCAFFVILEAYFYSRQQVLFTFIFFTSGLIFWRIGFVYILRSLRKKGFNYRKVIIVGYGDIAQDLKNFFISHPEHGYNFLGYFDNIGNGNLFSGKVDDVEQFALDNKVDEIYCCLPYVDYEKVRNIVEFAENQLIKVKVITDFRGFAYKNLTVEYFDEIPILNVTSIPLDNNFNRFLKRSFDILFSMAVIALFMSWLLPIIAFLIKIDSQGPIFFRQKRSGKGNNHFWCWKFRTMHINDECEVRQATKDDPRITRVGFILRKTSIDELPQFFNVLIGDMSIVGPRPHPLKLNEKFSPVIEKFMIRHSVKPGITGLAQAKGYRGETSTTLMMSNRVRLDRFYVENWSIILDMKIIILTVVSIVKGDQNAY
ncbi:undecaprenyl-phosphate glucose phosphotransferase [soil metagenome]